MSIDIQGMWPYWLEEPGRAPNTVANDISDMRAMSLLTGQYVFVFSKLWRLERG